MSIENKETNRSKPRYSVYRYAGMAASVTASYVSFKNQEVFAGISFAGLAGSLFGYE